jgi:hypothetical protein
MANDAERAARHMQRTLGWWPCDPQSGFEWQMYCEVHARALSFLHAQGIGAHNFRLAMHALSEYARAESEPLFHYISRGAAAAQDSRSSLFVMLNSPSACQAYILATLFSELGGAAEQRSADERQRAQRPHWQTRDRSHDLRGGREDSRGARGRSGRSGPVRDTRGFPARTAPRTEPRARGGHDHAEACNEPRAQVGVSALHATESI